MANPDPIPLATVDVERFMGNWYVQGHVPTPLDGSSYNAVESYARADGGKILTSFAHRKGGFDEPIRTLKPTAEVKDGATEAEWRMRFFWVFPAEYLIAHVDDAYTETIVARTKRDYGWIMTREPMIDDAHYARLVARLVALGYDEQQIRRVPQRWPDPEHPASQAAPESLPEATRR